MHRRNPFLSLLVTMLITALPLSARKENRATREEINGPSDLALDNLGHLFVLEKGDASGRAGVKVFRIDLGRGTITTVAGNGKLCCYKEGARATDVGFDYLFSMTIDSMGNLFLGDGSIIRKVDGRTGLISTFAGEKADPGDTEDGTPAFSTHFWFIDRLAVDSHGDLLVGDQRQGRVLKIEKATGTVHFYAGDGSPTGFAGDGGPATAASFYGVDDFALDNVGNLIIADFGNCRIRRVDHNTGIVSILVTTIAITSGVGKNCSETLDGSQPTAFPSDPVVDSTGNIYFVENGMVLRLDSKTSSVSIVAGNGHQGFSGDGGLATKAELNNPGGLAIDSNGNLFIAEFLNNRVRRVDAQTKIITTIAGNGRPHRIDIIL